MAKRRVLAGVVVGLSLVGGPPGVHAGPIARKFQEWSQNQPQVYTAQPSQTKYVDMNLSKASFSQRLRKRLPWHRSDQINSGFQMKTEYMKHRNDGTLVR